jgi:hypothetical protein
MYPHQLRHWISASLQAAGEGHSNAGRRGQGVPAVLITAAVVFPSWLTWQVFAKRFGLLDGLIALFLWFAMVIVAIPPGAILQTPPSHPQAPAQNGLLCVKAVFAFVEDHRLWAVHHLA